MNGLMVRLRRKITNGAPGGALSLGRVLNDHVAKVGRILIGERLAEQGVYRVRLNG